jgi:hypothetical protein
MTMSRHMSRASPVVLPVFSRDPGNTRESGFVPGLLFLSPMGVRL